ncbi:hypothetical protein D3C78_1037060 [compost metagenome]
MGHGCVEQPRHQQDDQEVHQRERRRRAQVELPYRHLGQGLAEEGGGVARPTARQYKGLGIDHEAVHKAQHHRDQKYVLHLRQLDVAEHRPGRRAIDARSLVVGIRDRSEPRVTQQRHQRGPMPDIHHQHRDPGIHGIGRIVVVDAQLIQRRTEQADVRAAENLPDRADHVPWNQQWNSHDDQTQRRPASFARHGQGDGDAQRNLDQQYTSGIDELAQQGVVQTRILQHLAIPVGTDEVAAGLVENILYRVIDHGHHRDHSAEGHQQEHRQHQPPGLVVGHLVHGSNSSSTSSA